MLLVDGGAGAPSVDPRQKRGAQDLSGIRAAFSLVSFFSTAWMQELEHQQ